MEAKGSLPHSQPPVICPYPEPDQSSPCFTNPLLEDQFLILASQLCLGLPSGRFPSGLSIKSLYTSFFTVVSFYWSSALQNCGKRLLGSSRLSVRPPAWNKQAATRKACMKFDIVAFFKNISRKFTFQ
jgi:hypothetical protein